MRRSGFDLLRLLLMLMVVTLHVLSGSGSPNSLLEQTVPFSAQYLSVWFLSTLSIPACDCFALLSGYLMLETKKDLHSSLTRYLQFWLFTFFFSLTVCLLSRVLGWHSADLLHMLKPSFPYFSTLWYVKAYLGLLLILPLLDGVVQRLNARQARYVTLVMLLISLIPQVSGEDCFALKDGYSTFWLAMLFLLGGFLRRFDWLRRITPAKAMLGYAVCIGLSFAGKIGEEYWYMARTGAYRSAGRWLSYLSPLIVLAAVFLFAFFASLPLKSSRVPELLGSAAFGIFVVHKNLYFDGRFVYAKADAYLALPGLQMYPAIAGRIAFVYIFSLLLSLLITPPAKALSQKFANRAAAFITARL